MAKQDWINRIDYKKYVSPFEISSDSQYLPSLKELLNSFVDDLSLLCPNENLISAASAYKHKIINAIDLYYQGNIISAQSIVNELINEFDEKSIAISNINDSIAFPPAISEESEVQFFRARLSDNIKTFPASEMLHIPFSKREIVKSERFSIPGLPCLYLANTSYACWIEMGCPPEHKFNVSPIVLDNTQKILNLTVTIRDLGDIAPNAEDKQLTTLIKLFMLSAATSFRVSSSNVRNFKSEYILPQMIMLACKQRNLDGITYYSKQVTDELFAHISGVNLVLFASFNGEEELSKICEHIEIDDSFNYSMFKQLLPGLLYKDYDLRILNSPYINNIGSFKYQFPYRETQFFEFDKYLFTRWKRK